MGNSIAKLTVADQNVESRRTRTERRLGEERLAANRTPDQLQPCSRLHILGRNERHMMGAKRPHEQRVDRFDSADRVTMRSEYADVKLGHPRVEY